MTALRDFLRQLQDCRTPQRHPDECACPPGGRDTETQTGIDQWDDKEQPR